MRYTSREHFLESMAVLREHGYPDVSDDVFQLALEVGVCAVGYGWTDVRVGMTANGGAEVRMLKDRSPAEPLHVTVEVRSDLAAYVVNRSAGLSVSWETFNRESCCGMVTHFLRSAEQLSATA